MTIQKNLPYYFFPIFTANSYNATEAKVPV